MIGEAAARGEALALSAQRWPPGTPPLVTILCTSYNHEEYIAAALDGFLRQETTFPVRVVVHDDASTDGTAEIVRGYVSRYPDLIEPILQKENQRSKGRWAISILIPLTKSKYFAICEGDDYWTSPDKLQTQIELLESKPEASGAIHNADGKFEDSGELIAGHFGPPVVKTEYGVDDLLAAGNFVPTASIVFRRSVIGELPAWLAEVPHCDIILLTMATLEGPLAHVNRSMSVYRKHSGGIHSRDTEALQYLKYLKTYFFLGAKLGMHDRPSFIAGLQYGFQGLERNLRSQEERIRALEFERDQLRGTADAIMGSKTFKVGLALSKLRDRIVARWVAS